jgi:hypothetical protein
MPSAHDGCNAEAREAAGDQDIGGTAGYRYFLLFLKIAIPPEKARARGLLKRRARR